jgi:glycosyltransferase involved in cell wall biosynthesis
VLVGSPPVSVPVTVVIPAYNRPDMTARAVRSALAQRPEPPAEVLVVDDCSSDGTADAAREAGARVLRHEVNRGRAQARNTGVREATQDWVGFLDSDDEWRDNLLAELWPLCDGHVLAGGAAWYREGTAARYRGLIRRRPLVLRTPASLAYVNLLACSAVLASREAVLTAGGFDTGREPGEDLDLWMRMLRGGTGVVSPVPVLDYHLHPQQTVTDREGMAAVQLDVLRANDAPSWRVEAWRGAAAWDALRRERGWGPLLFAARHPARLAGMAGIVGRRALLRRRARDWLAGQS